jgi:hypothetical protein
MRSEEKKAKIVTLDDGLVWLITVIAFSDCVESY